MLSVLLSTKFCNYLLCLPYCRAPKNDLLMEANAKTSEPTSFWRTNSWLFQSVICIWKWRHTMKRKSRTKWRKIHLYFHVYLKIIVWIFHFITVFRKHRFFLLVFVTKKWRHAACEIVFVDILLCKPEHGNVTDMDEFLQTGRSENGLCVFLVWFTVRSLKAIEILSYFSFLDFYTTVMLRTINQTWKQCCPFNYPVKTGITFCVR